MQSYGNEVTELFKQMYQEKKVSIDYFCQFGDSLQRANATLIRDIALQG